MLNKWSFLTLSNVPVDPCSNPVSECCRLVRSKELSFFSYLPEFEFHKVGQHTLEKQTSRGCLLPKYLLQSCLPGSSLGLRDPRLGHSLGGKICPQVALAWASCLAWLSHRDGVPGQVSVQVTSIQWAHLLESPLETTPKPADRERGFDSPSPTCCVPLSRALSLSEPLHHGHGLMDLEGTAFLGEKEMFPSCP